ncbi:HEAT repeat domain-containing protein [Aeromicrobium sp. Marseille-Q0843]|uniref:HEAT repeat domain-containing protein n=1 Tax=Aeromicrobium phoceense TaxID=2754045 RepID=A0A838XEN5_9ACTN|nr:HEAT repeat domain-containing protein [Aeromicrobium phoceense]MBA4607146.1 HEAT repeat domain-containing protein [Aeromicrobium phoceense]
MPDTTPFEQRGDDELVELAHRSRGDIAKESLVALVRRDSDRATPVAVELLTAHAEPRVRSLAAVTLGRTQDPDAPAALTRALADADPTVVRRAAQSLARVGDASVLPDLARSQPSEATPAGRAVLTARLLIGYRAHQPELLVPVTAEITEFGRRRGEEIAFGGRAKVAKATVLAAVRAEVPALAFASRELLTFTCSGAAGAVALAEDVGEVDLSVPQMLGVMVRERVCSERYSLDCYVLSDDRDATGGTRPYLWLVRPSGRVVHVGRLEVGDDRARFSVTGSVAPYANPVKVVGERTASGTLTIESALVGKPATGAARAAAPPAREALTR